MELTGKYKFPNWPSLEFVNPTLEIEIDTIKIQPSVGIISVDIHLSIFRLERENSCLFMYNLDEIAVNDFNYNLEQLTERVLTRLEDFKIN